MFHASPAQRPWHWRTSIALAVLGLLAACPAPSPSSSTTRRDPSTTRRDPATTRRDPATPRPAEPAPAPPAEPSGSTPAAEPPATEPSPSPDRPGPNLDSEGLPSALAAADVRPVARSLWRALEAVDAGDAGAIATAMTDDGRWFPPGRPEESVGGQADLRRALSPWSGDEIELDVRRIIDPGEGTLAAQVSVASREAAGLRYELVLLVEPRGELMAAVHHFGDPLGPVRIGSSPPGSASEEPLVLEPVGEPTLERGPAPTAVVELAGSLAKAVEARDDDAVRPRLADDVILHDVIARRTRRGRDGWLAGMRETLGPTGHLVVDRQLAGSRFVVVEGAVYGREVDAKAEPAAEPQEHGFVDVHRTRDGMVVETWHYVNRRGRPHHPRLRP